MAEDRTLRWERVASADGPRLPLFNVRFDLMRHPRSAQTFERLVLESVDWVNVVAITPGKRIIMVEQFRFGIGELTIEPTSGSIDPGEDSLTAARRELLEETGYGEGEWRYLGAVHPNPATQNNLCHLWLAEGVVPVRPPSPEAGEAIRVHLMALDDLKRAIDDGRIRHTLAFSALSRVFSLWDVPYLRDDDRDGPRKE